MSLLSMALAKCFYTVEGLRLPNPSESDIAEAKSVLNALSEVSTKDLLSELEPMEDGTVFSSSDIPQFSALSDCFAAVDRLVRSGMDDITYLKMGFFLRVSTRKKGADLKYGENHSKCAALMGLCYAKKGVKKNALSYAYESLGEETKEAMRAKLCLGIPLIRQYFLKGEDHSVIETAMECLSESTRKRRRSNINALVETVKKDIR